jgi:DNA-binding NarL/FixJ family response regulator
MKITKREQDVFELLIKGKTNKQIAVQLNISDFTVRDHVSSLLRKANVASRMELIARHHCVMKDDKLRLKL